MGIEQGNSVRTPGADHQVSTGTTQAKAALTMLGFGRKQIPCQAHGRRSFSVSYTHLRAHETSAHL
eukprot:2849403-Alexandrium_andersonii.AAC.1